MVCEHGTATAYKLGCRCDQCRAAQTAAMHKTRDRHATARRAAFNRAVNLLREEADAGIWLIGTDRERLELRQLAAEIERRAAALKVDRTRVTS